MMPAINTTQFSAIEAPEDTTPHVNAHMGGNQVMGCKTSSIAEGTGRDGAESLETVSVMGLL
jgi:hypothetical protein